MRVKSLLYKLIETRNLTIRRTGNKFFDHDHAKEGVTAMFKRFLEGMPIYLHIVVLRLTIKKLRSNLVYAFLILSKTPLPG